MLIDFSKPKKIMREEERREKYSSDCSVPGTYVSNMSENDLIKWKGKHIKGKNERIEIRKSLNGVNIVIIVYKEIKSEEIKSYSGDIWTNYLNKQIHISSNGTIQFELTDYIEFITVINEALDLLGLEKIKMA